MQFGPFGLPELLVIMTIFLVVFGPQKLPEMSRVLGKLLGEFRRGSEEFKRSLEREVRDLDRETGMDDLRAAVRLEPPAGAVRARSEEEEEPPEAETSQGDEPDESESAEEDDGEPASGEAEPSEDEGDGGRPAG